MSSQWSRRRFLSRGAAATAAGAAALAGGGTVLAACASGSGGTGSTSAGAAGSASPGIGRGVPKKGGTLKIGVEAEDNGFNPTVASWDVTGLMYGSCLFDTLTAIDANGKVQPYLAQSITPNADYTQWTLKLRSTPIKFHDGTILDSNAVVGSIEANVHSAQNGPAIANIASIANPDPATVVFTMKSSWVPFPYYLAGAIGTVMAPAMLKAQDAGNRAPIGTGPFMFTEWVPNDHLTVTRNPSYWQPGLPHLDSVVFHPIPDHQSRENSIKAGTIDLMHTTDTQSAVDFMHDPSFQYINDLHNHAGEREQGFYMINTAQPPLDDIRVRQAMAYAIDRHKIISLEYNGLPPESTGPFSIGSPYYVDPGYPSHNLAKAQSLVREYQAEKGPISFEISTINDAKTLATTQIVQSMLQQAGISAQIVQVQQSQYIVQALLGQYAVRQWRQFAASDPDQNYVWWASSTAAPVGKLALNFARNRDPQIDAALATGRTSADPTARSQAYQAVAKRFAQDIPYLWINTDIWSVVAKPNVQNFNNPVLPDGTTLGQPMTGGFVSPRFVWLS